MRAFVLTSILAALAKASPIRNLVTRDTVDFVTGTYSQAIPVDASIECSSLDMTYKCGQDNYPCASGDISDVTDLGNNHYEITFTFASDDCIDISNLGEAKIIGIDSPESGTNLLLSRNSNVFKIDDACHWSATFVINGKQDGSQICTPSFTVQYDWFSGAGVSTSEKSSWKYSGSYDYLLSCSTNNMGQSNGDWPVASESSSAATESSSKASETSETAGTSYSTLTTVSSTVFVTTTCTIDTCATFTTTVPITKITTVPCSTSGEKSTSYITSTSIGSAIITSTSSGKTFTTVVPITEVVTVPCDSTETTKITVYPTTINSTVNGESSATSTAVVSAAVTSQPEAVTSAAPVSSSNSINPSTTVATSSSKSTTAAASTIASLTEFAGEAGALSPRFSSIIAFAFGFAALIIEA
ncbi:hypothetical protein FOA43_001984 [Brettanomyces nanus]|uniref:Flo11 domain-containing protein n=1 Tax=Eeniella nana TaxID=13502 RepID=A0A875S3L3_EENNA|nr:uncharacterized protein FOA43_001984 [Brettanomyces nanus]QPG74652.1 hypothetical protein FOA43_001984 [Brettanomyces nanus]